MDSSDGKASNFERRSSTRRSLRLSTANGASDDDDYDLSAMMVADGFRPSENTDSGPASHPPQHHPDDASPSTPTTEIPADLHPMIATPQQPPTSKPPADQTPPMRNRPSSISKPPRSHDSLALRNDGTGASVGAGAHVARSSSISSDVPVMRVESPYRGPSGPSHPYQMYPQRTMSVATTSTTAAAAAAVIPEDRSYDGPRGPAHPYALYPQNTVLTNEPTSEAIPVGFNNMGGTYQRQLGPDGEEAGDMIGPLGHMEELPPYSRYPENNVVPKPAPATSTQTTMTTTTTATASATTDTTPNTTEPTSPIQDRTIAGAGGIGMATRDPEFSSTEDDLAMPRTRPSVRSNRSDASQHDVNTAARDIAEKPHMTKWQRRAKKKLWGIVPYWAICLLTVGLIIMGVVMGAVIGTVLTRHGGKKGPPPAQTSASSATTSEVVYLTALPTDLAKISTGHFGLPPWKKRVEPNNCFNDTTQASAWSCDMPFSYYSMDITRNANKSAPEVSGYQIVMAALNFTNAEFIWGTQPPSIADPKTLSLVWDSYQLELGPAWWTTVQYNKTVILSESDFSLLSKRGWDDDEDHPFPPPSQFKKKTKGAQKGDKPWVCKWPDVTLEIFIYPKQNTTTTTGWSSSTTTQSSATATTTANIDTDDVAPPSYPKVMKMIELRYLDKKSQTAYCSHVEILDEAKNFKPVCDAHGNPEEVTIQENSPSSKKFNINQRYRQMPKRWTVRDILARGDPEQPQLTNCGCLWWST
ncbi:hypothetical protein B0T10DRAFT_32053 [Thelonectria olida]|uniref:DUF7820 domain-containing protein n=1 Tax=Thelonectria olida TaxID=1576542 RepID=A0A9P8WLB9_9HYPO|nr:hypothetical protein B0T10DRAFT_32053 [Thelonectria olida]